jgi:hypothetical protein
MLSKLLDDGQLSREGGGLKWLSKTVLPPWLTYARQIVWQEPWFPSPRCLFGCTVLAATTLSGQTDTPGVASRIMYHVSDEYDGWFPVPSEDEHGGELILISSFRPCSPADVYQPPMTRLELDRLRASRSSAIDHWAKFTRAIRDVPRERLTGIILPEPPPPPPPPPKRSFLARLIGQ